MPVDYIPKPIKAVWSSPARAFGTIYQNTILRPIMVVATVSYIIGNPANVCTTIPYVDVSSPPIVPVGLGGNTTAGGGEITYDLHIFLVAPGEYYRIIQNNGAGNNSVLIYWREIEL